MSGLAMKIRTPLTSALLALSLLSACAGNGARPGDDSDGDLVIDTLDQCAATPAGIAVDPNGCPLAVAPPDADGDGVADGEDRCPDSTPGTLIDPQGCAAKIPSLPPEDVDSDADGILDAGDACPDTPADMKVDERGCAQAAQTLVLRNIGFANGSSELTPESHAVLDLIVAGLAGQPAMRLQIVGHTDDVGAEAYNLQLSQDRAAAVLAYLAEHGIATDRLSSTGEGEGQPVADNASAEGRALNRRVEFRVE
jgi:OOP family OmpA-OmpF porin